MPATIAETHNGRILAGRLLEFSSFPPWEEARREWELGCVYLPDTTKTEGGAE